MGKIVGIVYPVEEYKPAEDIAETTVAEPEPEPAADVAETPATEPEAKPEKKNKPKKA